VSSRSQHSAHCRSLPEEEIWIAVVRLQDLLPFVRDAAVEASLYRLKAKNCPANRAA